MADARNDVTTLGALRVEVSEHGAHLAHLRERIAEARETDEKHDERLTALEHTQWRIAAIVGGLALVGSGIGAWLAVGAAVVRAIAKAKGAP